jgi:hypothetical protein
MSMRNFVNSVSNQVGVGTAVAKIEAEPIVKLQCDMHKECQSPIAMIDNSGFIYCEFHGLRRRDWKPCRKLRAHELKRLQAGKQVTKY